MACSKHKVWVDNNNNDCQTQQQSYFKIEIIENGRVKSNIKNIDLSMSVADVIIEMFGDEDNILLVKKAYAENRTEVDKTITFQVLKDFGCKAVTVEVQRVAAETSVDKKQESSVFDVLMKASRSYTSFPEVRKTNNKKDELFNHVVHWFQQNKWGFTSQQVGSVGKHVIGTITDVMWYLDPFWQRFQARGIYAPTDMKPFTGYRDLKSQKKKIPEDNIEKLSEIMMLPWITSDNNGKLRECIESLLEGMRKYVSFLNNMKSRTKANQNKPEPVRNIQDNWLLNTIESANCVVKSEYSAIDQALKESEEYQMIDIINFEPSEKEDRRKWLKNLSVSCCLNLYSYRYGNNLGNMNIVWKIPGKQAERNAAEVARNINKLKQGIMTFATRRMMKDFVDRYSKTNVQSVVLRNMYRFLTDFEYSPHTENQSEVDERFMKFLVETEDCELIYDLRKYNGRPNDPKFQPFWESLQKLLDETSAVHERRHNEHQYLPLALSVEDIRDQVLERLPNGTPAPSVSWIRLNFQPRNPYNKSAEHYTGKVQLRYAVQQRLLRVQHIDASYCRQQFLLLKNFSVKYKDLCHFESLDDKAVVPVGNPDQPVSTGVRSHHGAIVANADKVVALDHDFHVAGIVPSVLFTIDIPESVYDSFYNGSVHVTIKDKVFQPSSPLRHSAETVKVLRTFHSENDVSLGVPILVRYTDGGPDHRTNYKSVQMACLLEFIALDLDMLVATRTAPSQSYHNPAERIMSTLNLGLQNVALDRGSMRPEFEMQVKSLNSLKALRNASEKNPSLKKAYVESMDKPLTIVKERFKKLKWKGEGLHVNEAASTEEMDDIGRLIEVIDPEVSIDNQKTWNSPRLQSFLNNHTRKRHYMYQIKKCTSDECAYCVINPPRIPEDIFQSLHFVPDPVMKDGQYVVFDQIYGTETDDSTRPSMQNVQPTSERDKKLKKILVATKVRAFITCRECGKRRVIYSAAKLTTTEIRSITRVEEELLYICGNPLFYAGIYRDRMIVKEGLLCSSDMEASYYAGKTVVFDDVCFYCGDTEVLDTDEVKRLKEDFGIVRPICKACKEIKPIKTRNAKKVKKQKSDCSVFLRHIKFKSKHTVIGCSSVVFIYDPVRNKKVTVQCCSGIQSLTLVRNIQS